MSLDYEAMYESLHGPRSPLSLKPPIKITPHVDTIIEKEWEKLVKEYPTLGVEITRYRDSVYEIINKNISACKFAPGNETLDSICTEIDKLPTTNLPEDAQFQILKIRQKLSMDIVSKRISFVKQEPTPEEIKEINEWFENKFVPAFHKRMLWLMEQIAEATDFPIDLMDEHNKLWRHVGHPEMQINDPLLVKRRMDAKRMDISHMSLINQTRSEIRNLGLRKR